MRWFIDFVSYILYATYRKKTISERNGEKKNGKMRITLKQGPEMHYPGLFPYHVDFAQIIF